jgi:ABC-type bacteriocin/lantibiotic exporter with double-glycine peptidase domain
MCFGKSILCRRLILAVALAVAFSAEIPRIHAKMPAQKIMLQVPIIKQSYMHCLVASVSMVLKYWGVEIPPEAIEAEVPVYKNGTTGRDLAEFVESAGFRGFLIQPEFEDLFGHLEKLRPLIVTLPEGDSLRHAMVLVGVDASAGVVWLNDPAGGRRVSRKLESFRRQWEKGQRWTFLIVPK